jgi:hypothetical protein
VEGNYAARKYFQRVPMDFHAYLGMLRGSGYIKEGISEGNCALQKPFWRVQIEPLAPLRRSGYITKCIFEGNCKLLTKIQLANCYSINLVSMGLTVSCYWGNNICYTPWPDNKWYNNNNNLIMYTEQVR